MAAYQPKPYKKKNKLTGLWETVIPPLVDLVTVKKVGVGSGHNSRPMRPIVSIRVK